MVCDTLSLLFGIFMIIALIYWMLELHYFLRMLVSFLQSKLLKKKMHVLDPSSYSSICFTTDIDILLFHMNNARYLREVDFARADFYSRTGLWQRIREKEGLVFQGATMIRYRRFIKLFSRYRIVSQIVYWEENAIYMEHKFISQDDGFVRAIVYGKQSVVKCNVEEVMAELMRKPECKISNDSRQKPECPLEILLWIESTAVSSKKLRTCNV